MANWIILGAVLVGVQPPSTAEELLEALRRKRPINDVIQPASALERADERDRPLLWPEGSARVDQTGRLKKAGHWWTFVPEPADTHGAQVMPKTKLLPNANLEVLVRTARGASAPVTFVVSGDMTVFQDENYLLVRVARRAREAPSDTKPTAPSEEPGSSQPRSTGGQAARGTPGTRSPPAVGDAERLDEVSVDEVLRAMREREPRQPILSTLQPSTNTSQGSRAMAAGILRPDGSMIVRRPGRLIREKDWWVFAFESDDPDEPELPIRLLPNKSLELMVREAKEESSGLIFLVTGDVTLFERQNYLLPRVAIRRIDLGNLTK